MRSRQHADASTSNTPFIDQPQWLIKCKPFGNLLYRFSMSPPDVPGVLAAQTVRLAGFMRAPAEACTPQALLNRQLAVLRLGHMLPAGNMRHDAPQDSILLDQREAAALPRRHIRHYAARGGVVCVATGFFRGTEYRFAL